MELRINVVETVCSDQEQDGVLMISEEQNEMETYIDYKFTIAI